MGSRGPRPRLLANVLTAQETRAEFDAISAFIDTFNEEVQVARARLPEQPLHDYLAELILTPSVDMQRLILALIDAASGPSPAIHHDPLRLLVAAESLAKELRNPPARAVALMRVAVSRSRVGMSRRDFADAVAALDLAATHVPDTYQGDVWLAEIRFRKATVLAQSGDHESAMELLMDAYRFCSDDIAAQVRQCFADWLEIISAKRQTVH